MLTVVSGGLGYAEGSGPFFDAAGTPDAQIWVNAVDENGAVTMCIVHRHAPGGQYAAPVPGTINTTAGGGSGLQVEAAAWLAARF